MLLADPNASPIEMLYDSFSFIDSTSLINLNVALGFMKWQDAHTVIITNPYLVITKQVVFIWIAFVIVLAVMLWARFISGMTKGGAPKGLRNFVEPVLAYIRNQIVYPNIKDPHGHGHGHGHDHGYGDAHGHDHGHGHGAQVETHKLADKLMPFFVTLFFFFATINLVGLIPGSATPTNSITITATMAITVFLVYFIGGMVLQKPFVFGFFKNLVPQCPIFLWPLLFVIELVGTIAKPFALAVRLFANMTAGHCILYALAGLAYAATVGLGGVPGVLTGVAPAIFSVAIYGLEVFVALLQAYIFTYLSAIFIGSYLVPEH